MNKKLLTNYFKFGYSTAIFKYKVTTEPQIPPNQIGLHMRVLSRIRGEIEKVLDPYQPFNFMVYSPVRLEDETTFESEYENVKYQIFFSPSGTLRMSTEDKEAIVFMGRLFKLLQRNLKLQQIGRKNFNDKAPEDFPSWKLTVWPGYQTSLNFHKDKALINIDTCFKVIRETSALEHIENLIAKFNGDQNKVREEFLGSTIMTKYNNIMYQIHEIEFDSNPSKKFELRDGGSISYAEYYEKKYNKKLTSANQPLLIHIKDKNKPGKEKKTEICLMPELCVLTGQSAEMRNNFQLQKDLNRIIKPNPQTRMNKSKELIDLMRSNPSTSAILQKWNINISSQPLDILSKKLEAGDIIMGQNNRFSLESTPDFDRKIQAQMLDQPVLNKVGVFCNSRDKEVCRTFMQTLKSCVETFRYPMGQPKEIYVDGRDYRDWEKAFRSNLDTSVQAVFLILPGKKKSAPFYEDCKRFLLMDCPIPSQVILCSTIASGKNLRSIINKVLIQICAKIGGTPWSVSDIPFMNEPTMIVGVDILHKSCMKSKSLVSFCATINKNASRYWSTVSLKDSKEEIGIGIQDAVKNAMIEFKNCNKIYPKNIIVYRDGVSLSQSKQVTEVEVSAFTRAFEELKAKKELSVYPEFIYICANKKVGAKFFSQGGGYGRDGLVNPDQGVIIDEEIDAGKDFYLISQKTHQGSAAPTHYFVLSHYVNEQKDGKNVIVEKRPEEMTCDLMEKLQKLTYKLCYMYYNWSGSIKVPAPIQYAHKLTTLIGDRYRADKPILPHKSYESYKSLYFI